MAKLYYGKADEFEVLEFASRKVIDEIEMSMTAFDCVFPDNAAIYCSGDITTGKRLYDVVLKKYGVRSHVELKEKLGTGYKPVEKKELIDVNVPRGEQFAAELRNDGKINVVTPGPFYARGFDQEHYLYLWEAFITRKACEVRFNYDWEYSNGCTFEYAVAANKGIPRLDREGNPIDIASAIAKVKAALTELRKDKFVATKLEENLALIEKLQQ
jgi:hypothetical protein